MKKYMFIFDGHETFYNGKSLAEALTFLKKDLAIFPGRKLDNLLDIQVETVRTKTEFMSL